MTLDQLRSLPGGADLERDWAAGQAQAAGRAAGDGQPGWAASRAAALAYACDAQIAPMVTDCLDPAALAQAVHVFLAAAHRGPGCYIRGCTCQDAAASGIPGACEHPAAGPEDRARKALPPMTLDRLTSTLLRYAAQMLSGPGGLASFLRTGLAGPLAAGVSLPLDLGAPTATIPPHLRRALIERDRHCAFPGCTQPPAACHGHHLIPRSRGGATALHNLALLCSFHHLIAVHRWGWTLQLNADGTTTATSPDRTRVLHSHGPPQVTAA